jgi:hypothetical protein
LGAKRVRCNGKRQGRGSQTETELAAEGGEAQETQAKPLRPRQCHKYLQRTLASEFRSIVAGFVDEARKGGCSHMKLAVELLEPAVDEGRPRKGSAQRLLEELGE